MCSIDWVGIVTAAAASATALFAFLTWRVYVRMNGILSATNAISAQMVAATRNARFHSTAPILRVEVVDAMPGFETRDEQGNETGSFWGFDVLISNVGRGAAKYIECEPTWNEEPGYIFELDPWQRPERRKRLFCPRTGADPSEIRVRLTYEDEHGNHWDARAGWRTATVCRLVRDVVDEATRPE